MPHVDRVTRERAFSLTVAELFDMAFMAQEVGGAVVLQGRDAQDQHNAIVIAAAGELAAALRRFLVAQKAHGHMVASTSPPPSSDGWPHPFEGEGERR